MTHYYWLSFSRIVRRGERGNLGAVIMTATDELDFEQQQEVAFKRGLVPEGTQSIAGGELNETEALGYPLDRFMTAEELAARDDVVTQRDRVDICPDCLEKMGIEGHA